VRLPKIEALDIRPAHPRPWTMRSVQCVDCGRRFTGVEGQRCIRCRLVASVAETLAMTYAEAWEHVRLHPVLAAMVVDEHAERWLAAAFPGEPNPVAGRSS
jgi:hypothetical protein